MRCVGVEERNGLLQVEPGEFFITPGYSGCPAVLVRLSQVDLHEMIGLVALLWWLLGLKRLLAAYDAEHPPAP